MYISLQDVYKRQAISCIKINPEGINNFARLFRPKDADWSDNGPYCCFNYSVLGHEMELVFRMNKAGLSKLDPVWLGIQKERLDDGRWLYHTLEEGRVGTLNTCLLYTSCTEKNNIGIIATKATISSGDYREKIKKLDGSLKVVEKATPAFVPLIEEGIIENEIMDLTIPVSYTHLAVNME